MSRKFSIIVPFLNSEKTLEKCLNSIVAQKYSNIEVIMIDNGSADNSKQIVDSFKQVLKIKYLYNKKAKIGKLRNIGIKQVSGDYILFLDSDDFFCDGLIALLNKKLDEYGGIDIVRFNANRIELKETTEYEINKYKLQETPPVSPKEFFKIAKTINCEIGPLWLYCYRAEFFKSNKFKFLNFYIHEDLLNDYILCCAKEIANLDFIGYNYVKNVQGITYKKSAKGEFNRAKAIIKNYNYVSRLMFKKISKDIEFFNIRFEVFNFMLEYNFKYFEGWVLNYYKKEVLKCMKLFNKKQAKLLKREKRSVN